MQIYRLTLPLFSQTKLKKKNLDKYIEASIETISDR